MANNRKFIEVLMDLHKNSLSGVLRVERGSEKKQLVLINGLLAFAESNLPDEHLARIMVKLNLIPQTKVKEIALQMKNGKTSEEAILSQPGLSPEDFDSGRREQAMVILASLLGWNEPNLHFYPGEDLLRYQRKLYLSLPEILILSVRYAAANRLIPNPPSMQGTFAIAEDFAEIASTIPLNSTEAYAYSLLCGGTNAADILSIIPASDAKPEEVLLRLFALGLIVRKEDGDGTIGSISAASSDSIIQDLDNMLANFESSSLYDVLSVQPDATVEKIQSAYHDLAKQYHPDRFQSKSVSPEARSKAEQVFTRINEAYTTLRDPVFRKGYDEKRFTQESKLETELKARTAKRSEDEKTAEGLYRDGRALLAKGDFEKAVERFKGSAWLCPEKATYYHYLGVAESEIPSLRKNAEQHLLKALELDHTTIATRLELAKLYIKVMLRRKAEQQLQELMRWDPQNKEAHRLFAELKELQTVSSGQGTKNPFTRS